MRNGRSDRFSVGWPGHEAKQMRADSRGNGQNNRVLHELNLQLRNEDRRRSIEKRAGYNRSGLRIQAIRIRNFRRPAACDLRKNEEAVRAARRRAVSPCGEAASARWHATPRQAS